MRKPYYADEYRCKESGLTDLAIADYVDLLAMERAGSITRERKEQALEILCDFRDAGFGWGLKEVGEYIKRHIQSCEECRKRYKTCMEDLQFLTNMYILYDRYGFHPTIEKATR